MSDIPKAQPAHYENSALRNRRFCFHAILYDIKEDDYALLFKRDIYLVCKVDRINAAPFHRNVEDLIGSLFVKLKLT